MKDLYNEVAQSITRDHPDTEYRVDALIKYTEHLEEMLKLKENTIDYLYDEASRQCISTAWCF